MDFSINFPANIKVASALFLQNGMTSLKVEVAGSVLLPQNGTTCRSTTHWLHSPSQMNLFSLPNLSWNHFWPRGGGFKEQDNFHLYSPEKEQEMGNHLLPRSVSNGRCEKVHFARLWNTDANKTQTMRGMMIMRVTRTTVRTSCSESRSVSPWYLKIFRL